MQAGTFLPSLSVMVWLLLSSEYKSENFISEKPIFSLLLSGVDKVSSPSVSLGLVTEKEAEGPADTKFFLDDAGGVTSIQALK